MPETPMDEYDRLIVRQNDIGFTAEAGSMEVELEALFPQQPGDQHFGSGVAAPDPGHHPAAGFGIHYIGHNIPCLAII